MPAIPHQLRIRFNLKTSDSNLHLLASIHLSDHARSVLYPEAERVYRAVERVTFEHDIAGSVANAGGRRANL
jgi:hypothetical protein